MLWYKNNEIKNKVELMSNYGAKEFASPYRSTIPLIELFFENESEMEKIIPNFQANNCVFEYGTPVQKGKGKVSCTDLMIFNINKGFCIEAKRTEDEYPTVKKWLGTGNRENRKLVLSGWLDLIEKRCKTNLNFKNVEELPYQMIHRFASACNINENSELLYFCFELDKDSFLYYENNLNNLSKLTNRKVLIKMITFNIEATKEFKFLEDEWNSFSKKIDMSEEVQQLMAEGKVLNIKIDDINVI